MSSRRRASASAKRNGPGPEKSGGLASGTSGSTAARGTVTQGLSAIACQHRKFRRSGFVSARRRLAKAARESEKNITPKREIARSNAAGGKSCVSASAAIQSTGAAPAGRGRARAAASSGSDRSAATTRPAAPTASAATSAVAPEPQPTSRTRSPGRRAAAENSAWVSGANTASSTPWLRAQRWPTAPFQYSAWVIAAVVVAVMVAVMACSVA